MTANTEDCGAGDGASVTMASPNNKADTEMEAVNQATAAPLAISMRQPRKPLQIWPISDFHLAPGEGWSAGHMPQADVSLVAGDVSEGLVTAVEWLALHIRPQMQVVFVPGNHEFCGTMHDSALQRGKEAAALAGIHLLDGDAPVIGDVRFVGGPRHRLARCLVPASGGADWP